MLSSDFRAGDSEITGKQSADQKFGFKRESTTDAA